MIQQMLFDWLKFEMCKKEKLYFYKVRINQESRAGKWPEGKMH